MPFSHTRHSVHENGSGASSTCAVTLASTVANASLVFVSVGWASNAGDTVTGIADNQGNSYTLVDLSRNTTVAYSWQTAYLDGITNAPITITATLSASRTFITIVVGEYTGSLGRSSLNGHAINTQTNPGTTANAITSTNFTPAINNSLIYASLVDAGSLSGVSAGTNYTLRLNNSGGSFDAEDRTLAVAAAVAATFTTSASDAFAGFTTGGMAIKPFSLVNRAINIQKQSIVRASSW